MVTKCVLFIDAHDSAADTTVHAVPMTNVPPNVRKVLAQADDPFAIHIDKDGWMEMVSELALDEQEECEHQWVFPLGPRDNGEYGRICRLCGDMR